MKKLGVFIFLFAIILSCKEGKKQTYLPDSIGGINTIAVVVDNQLWQGKVGDKIREYFAASAVGLTLDEPIFTINHVPPAVFTGTIRNMRAVLFVEKDTLNIGHVKTDLYASPQKIGVIKGHTEDEIIANLDAKAQEIIAAFKALEITEAQKRFKGSLSKETVLKDKFGVSLTMPAAFKVVKQEDNFVWMETQIPKGTMNVIAYELPESSFSNDSTFVADIVRLRDSIGSVYIPGPDVPGKITHMRGDPAFAPHVFATELGAKKAVEVRGIWDIKNFPMAGPFVSYIINDKENGRKLVLEGFTFAPSANKRDYMFELEAIIRSAKFD
ncbi:DUF4837 family protein [Aurantibacter crassamenti]|uniref:DUF4837 family protein n=1 Tax=Aurantibacter crassamenti TaxID=1837375 RepID=UPI001939983B|nr:DUF4837 family protein [Aurantibacter crassamenti]MBM1105240.1 DUF4837 family protein [Aurantibacter crassamenti]